MAKRGKKYKNIISKKPVETLALDKAIEEVKKLSYSSFDGTIEFHFAIKVPTDVDPKSIKASFSLPTPLGKEVKIAVFTTPENDDVAKTAGADLVGLDELTKAVKAGKFEFDVAIATPDVMPKIAALGKELGPRGLMPNPKTGTVTDVANLEATIKEYKAGKLNVAADESGVVHLAVGKVNIEDDKIAENVITAMNAFSESLGKQLPQLTKSTYLAPTMGPSVRFEYRVEEES